MGKNDSKGTGKGAAKSSTPSKGKPTDLTKGSGSDAGSDEESSEDEKVYTSLAKRRKTGGKAEDDGKKAASSTSSKTAARPPTAEKSKPIPKNGEQKASFLVCTSPDCGRLSNHKVGDCKHACKLCSHPAFRCDGTQCHFCQDCHDKGFPNQHPGKCMVGNKNQAMYGASRLVTLKRNFDEVASAQAEAIVRANEERDAELLAAEKELARPQPVADVTELTNRVDAVRITDRGMAWIHLWDIPWAQDKSLGIELESLTEALAYTDSHVDVMPRLKKLLGQMLSLLAGASAAALVHNETRLTSIARIEDECRRVTELTARANVFMALKMGPDMDSQTGLPEIFRSEAENLMTVAEKVVLALSSDRVVPKLADVPGLLAEVSAATPPVVGYEAAAASAPVVTTTKTAVTMAHTNGVQPSAPAPRVPEVSVPTTTAPTAAPLPVTSPPPVATATATTATAAPATVAPATAAPATVAPATAATVAPATAATVAPATATTATTAAAAATATPTSTSSSSADAAKATATTAASTSSSSTDVFKALVPEDTNTATSVLSALAGEAE
jgi:hypothetical protein